MILVEFTDGWYARETGSGSSPCVRANLSADS